jgi:hypothetical protein
MFRNVRQRFTEPNIRLGKLTIRNKKKQTEKYLRKTSIKNGEYLLGACSFNAT